MDFIPFNKIPRLNRNVIVTEKIDGTNACIGIAPTDTLKFDNENIVSIVGDHAIFAGRRSSWVTPSNDNFGFARWVKEHAEELVAYLGTGRYFGEWWGKGIQRGYGIPDKRLSLFNTTAFCLHNQTPKELSKDPKASKLQRVLPSCVGLVPVLYEGPFNTDTIERIVRGLSRTGSMASPGFLDPEGIVVFHEASGSVYKVTIKDDDKRKSE